MREVLDPVVALLDSGIGRAVYLPTMGSTIQLQFYQKVEFFTLREIVRFLVNVAHVCMCSDAKARLRLLLKLCSVERSLFANTNLPSFLKPQISIVAPAANFKNKCASPLQAHEWGHPPGNVTHRSRNTHVDPVHPHKLHVIQQVGIRWHTPPRKSLRSISQHWWHTNHPGLSYAHARQKQVPAGRKLTLRLLAEHEEEGAVACPPSHPLAIHLEPTQYCMDVRASASNSMEHLEIKSSPTTGWEDPMAHFSSHIHTANKTLGQVEEEFGVIAVNIIARAVRKDQAVAR